MDWTSVEVMDIVIGVALAWAMFKGFRKGFIIKIASLLALVLGVFAGFYGSNGLADWLSKETNWSSSAIGLWAFILTFILVVIGVHFLAKLIEKVVDLTALGIINKLAGMVLGFVQMTLLLSIITYAMDGVFGPRKWLPEQSVQASILYPHVETAIEWVIPEMNRNTPWEEVRDRVQDGVQKLRDTVEDAVDELD